MSTAVLNVTMIQKRNRYSVGKVPATPTLTLRLYVNNHTPVATDAPAAYTECTLPGYGGAALTPANWVESTVGAVVTSSYPTITFTFTGGGQTIYGHYVTDGTDATVAWAELWDVPFVVPMGGGSVSVTLQFKDEQCP